MDPIISQFVIVGLNGLLIILGLLCFDAVVRICVLSFKRNREKAQAAQQAAAEQAAKDQAVVN